MNRKGLVLAGLLAAASAGVRAEVLHGQIENYGEYGESVACAVDAQYELDFREMVDAESFSSKRTERSSALALLGFFKDVDQNACHRVHEDGSFNLELPNRNTFVVVVVLTESGSNVYWHVENVAGAVEQEISVQPPKL